MPGPARQAKEAFGGRLREIRLDAGLSSRELAGLTGFHFTAHGNSAKNGYTNTP